MADSGDDRNIFDDLFERISGGAELVGGGIYKSFETLIAVPWDYGKMKVALLYVENYIKGLDIDEKVKDRVVARLKRPSMKERVIPFLFAVKDLYSLRETPLKLTHSGEIVDFEAWVRRNYPHPRDIPGFFHTLRPRPTGFEANEENGFELDPKLVGMLVELYDALYLKGDPVELGREFNRFDPERVELVKPLIKKALLALKKQVEGPHGGEALTTINSIINDPVELDKATYTVIDFVHTFVDSHYQRFARSQSKKVVLRKWMEQSLDEFIRDPDSDELWSYIDKALYHRRYAVHVVVDGLQGNLVESLVKMDTEFTPFLSEIYKELERGVAKQTAEFKDDEDHTYEFLQGTVGENELYKDKNFLPWFKWLYRNRPKGISPVGVSTTPTISVRNLPVAMMGEKPEKIGLPNFHYVERKNPKYPDGRAYYFFGTDGLYLGEIASKNGAKTLFERLWGSNTMNCFGMWDKAANYSLSGFLNLPLGEKMRDWGEKLCLAELDRRAQNEIKLQALRKELKKYKRNVESLIIRKVAKETIAQIAQLEDEGMPQYLLYYNPWPDHFAHFVGPFSDEIVAPTGELNRLDYYLQAIDKIYLAAGIYNKTLFGMAGDHGLSPVFHTQNPEEVAFKKFAKDNGIELIIRKISSDEGGGFKLNHPIKADSMKGIDIVVASTAGGNFMADFFDHKRWSEQLVYTDLQAYKILNPSDKIKAIDIPKLILDYLGDSLDYAIFRESLPTKTSADIVLTGVRKGEAIYEVVKKRKLRDEWRMFYKESADLLQVRKQSKYRKLSAYHKRKYTTLRNYCLDQAEEKDPSTWCTERLWRELTSYTNRPDSVAQIAHIYDTDLAGTVNLFPKDGHGYNTTVPGRHAGESFHEKDAFVGFWGNQISPAIKVKSFVNGSVPVTLYEYINGKVDEKKDGFGYQSVGKDLWKARR